MTYGMLKQCEREVTKLRAKNERLRKYVTLINKIIINNTSFTGEAHIKDLLNDIYIVCQEALNAEQGG